MKKQVFNPYLPPYEYIPDAEPRVFDERLYVYGSHDKFGGKWYCENDYVCWSAPLSDLSDWRYEGVIYKKSQDKRSGNLYAPDVVQGFDGRYYLYYSKDDSSVISVAVCDTPSGQYDYYGDIAYTDGRTLGDSETEYFMFDPSILIDGEKIWLYSGSSKRPTTTGLKRKMAGCVCVELEQDMKTVKAMPRLVLKGAKSLLSNGYFEAPSARKIGDLYYLVYSARNGSGLHYATSKFPDSGFAYRGCIHSTSDVGINGHTLLKPAYPLGNTHGGLVNLNGEWYIFDHRMTNRTNFSRQGVAEKITIHQDGSIEQAEATSQGLNTKPLNDEEQYPAYIACNLMCRGLPPKSKLPCITQSGSDDDKTSDFYVASVKNGTFVGYKYFEFVGGDYQITVAVRGDEGELSVMLNEAQAPIGKVTVKASPDWHTAIVNCHIPKGKSALFFTYNGKGKTDLLNFKINRRTNNE